MQNKTLELMVRTAITGSAALILSFTGIGCITGLYDCHPDPTNAYREICKKDVCVKSHEEEGYVESTHRTFCNDETGCRDSNGEQIEKGKWYDQESIHQEYKSVCDKYELITVIVEHDTPVAREESREIKECDHYNSDHECIGYITLEAEGN